jgi:hypothetical protein
MRTKLPVQKDQRKEWEERFKEFVEAALPEPKKLFRKPGLAARLFSAEVELPGSNPRDMEVYTQQLELVWPAKLPEGAESQTLASEDRNDVIWEFAVDLGTAYVTGSVKLRNFPFERPAPRERSERPGERPYRRDGGDRPRGGGYRGDRPPQRRDSGPPRERKFGDRPYKRRPPKD